MPRKPFTVEQFRQNLERRFTKALLALQKADTECWLWVKTISRSGYGLIKTGRRLVLAHRLSYEVRHGVRLARTQLVCHKCDVRNCINPTHLFVGTWRDNAQDMIQKRRHKFGEEHHHAKLTWDDVIAIRETHSKGLMSSTELAAKYEMCRRQINAIVSRCSWRVSPWNMPQADKVMPAGPCNKGGRPFLAAGTVYGPYTIEAVTPNKSRGGSAVYAVRCRCGQQYLRSSDALGKSKKAVGCCKCGERGKVLANRRRNPDRIAAVLVDRKAGMTVRDIATKYEVTPSRIRQIINKSRICDAPF